MKFPGFIGSSYTSRSSAWDQQRAINLYVEVDESGAGKEPRAMIGTPGIHAFGTLPTLPTSPLRCLWAGHGRAFAVAGSHYYELFSDGTYTDRGDVGDDSSHTRAQIWANGTQVMIISAGFVWIDTGIALMQPTFNVGGTAYTDLAVEDIAALKVSSAAHPFTAADVGTYLAITSGTNWIPGTRAKIVSVDGSFIATLDTAVATVDGAVDGHAGQDFGQVTAVMGGYLDGYYIVQKPDSNTVYLSQPLDGTSWDINDNFAKEGAPDRLTALIVDHEEIWLFGYETNEVWRDTGNGVGGFPMEKDPGATMHRGIAARWSAASLHDGVAWIGEDIRGRGVAYKAQGYQPVRISTHAVEAAWATYSTIADAEAFVYEEQGHEDWVITFPTANATWVYDATASAQLGSPQWHERTWYHSGSSLSGVCSVNGTKVTYVSGNHFTPQIFTITIGGVTYGASPGSTAGVFDQTKVILSSDAGVQNNVAFTATTLDRQRQRVHCFAFFKHLVGDWANGNVYEQHIDFFDDNGVNIVSRRTASPLADEEITYFGKQFLLEMESGDGTCSPVLDWSNDRGKTFGVQHVGFGTVQDNFSTRFPWRRLGKWRHRTFRITITEQVKKVITAADLDVEKGLF